MLSEFEKEYLIWLGIRIFIAVLAIGFVFYKTAC